MDANILHLNLASMALAGSTPARWLEGVLRQNHARGTHFRGLKSVMRRDFRVRGTSAGGGR